MKLNKRDENKRVWEPITPQIDQTVFRIPRESSNDNISGNIGDNMGDSIGENMGDNMDDNMGENMDENIVAI